MTRNRSFNPRTLCWIINLACLLALGTGLVVFYRAFYVPIAASQQSDDDRISQLEEFVQAADAVRNLHRHLTELVAAEELRAQEMLARIPVTPDDAEFNKQMSAIAAELKLKAYNFQRETIQEQDGLSQLDVKLSCLGKYEAICQFLDRITHLRRVINIERLEIQASNSGNDYPLALHLTLYFDPQRDAKQQSGQVVSHINSPLTKIAQTAVKPN